MSRITNLSRRLLGGGTLGTLAATAALAASAAPASAAPGGVYEINNHRHFAGLTQEVGSDEFYLLTFNFKAQIGVPGTFQVWGNSPYEIDDIDDEEYHSVKASMGQAKFDITPWSPLEVLLGRGPWVFGSVTQMMEKDSNSLSGVRSIQNAILESIRINIAPEVDRLDLATLLSALRSEEITAFFNPLAPDSAARTKATQAYVKKLTDKFSRDVLKRVSIWDGLRALRDDVVGTPHFTIVAGVDGATATSVESQAVSLGFNKPEGDQVFGLPAAGVVRNYKQQYKGTKYKVINSSSKPRYVMDVRTQKIG